MSEDRRRVPLDGCANFRDLGGYQTADGRRLRWGHLYRSDGLHELTPSDVRLLREERGLRAIVDLRTPHEVAEEGPGALAADPVRYHHVSLMAVEREAPRPQIAPDAPFSMDLFYTAMLRDGAPRVRQVIDVLARADGPAVFHCTAGKDRTGVIAAVVLALLGVDDAQIIDDYALTRHALGAIRNRLRRSRGYERMWSELPPETLHAHPETMQRTLDGVREVWGSMEAYAEVAGIEPDMRERLRDRLLESA